MHVVGGFEDCQPGSNHGEDQERQGLAPSGVASAVAPGDDCGHDREHAREHKANQDGRDRKSLHSDKTPDRPAC